MNAELAIQPSVPGSLSTLSTRFSSYRLAEETFMEPIESAEGPFTTYDDFRQHGLRTVTRKVRIYGLFGGEVQLIVPAPYAENLDKARQLALAAEKAKNLGQERVAEAELQFAADSLSKRVLPEELEGYLEQLPLHGLFSRVFLLDEPNPEDLWVRQVFSPSFVSAMATQPNGDLLLFKTEKDEFLLSDLLHEWSHRLQQVQAEDSQAFEDAIELGWRSFVPKPYALRSYGEHWAVFGEELLHPDSERFLAVTKNAPIRSSVWMIALGQALIKCEKSRRGCHYQTFLARVNFVKANVLASAKQSLAEILASEKTDIQAKERAQRLCHYLDLKATTVNRPVNAG